MSEANNNFNKNNMIKKIRSKYIVMKIFDDLKLTKLLDIIHYNKEYPKLMKIKLKDYKNEFSKIEIEIIPKENTYGKFINFSKNIQIYFNDNKKEIEKRKITKDDKVTKIKIIINHNIKSLSDLFSRCKCIKKINFIKFNRDDINDMSWMFCRCISLEEINLSNFNTTNVTNMAGMFSYCSSLKELDLSNFNTSKIEYMNYMFKGCSSNLSLICSNELIKKKFLETKNFK